MSFFLGNPTIGRMFVHNIICFNTIKLNSVILHVLTNQSAARNLGQVTFKCNNMQNKSTNLPGQKKTTTKKTVAVC